MVQIIVVHRDLYRRIVKIVCLDLFCFKYPNLHQISRFHWKAMIVDEAHRLKNFKSALYQELSQVCIKNQ